MAKLALSGRCHNQYLETTKKNINGGGREGWGQKKGNSEGGLEQILNRDVSRKHEKKYLVKGSGARHHRKYPGRCWK